MARKHQPTVRSRRIALILAAVCAAAAVPVLIVLVSLADKTPNPWFGQYDPDPHPAYQFSLTDQNGKPVSLKDLRGQVVLLNFGFTRCPNICPTTLGNLAAIYRKLPPDAQERTKVVFVSVDERDTPETLKEYVPFFNERFIGLTGAPADIGTTARAYGAFFRKAAAVGSDPGEYMIDHSTYTHLIDPEGNLRLLYRFEQLPETDRIAEDIQRILGKPIPDKSLEPSAQ